MIVRKRAVIQYILLYFLLIMHGAIVWVLKYSLSFISLGIVGAISILIIYKYKARISQQVTLLAIILGVLFVLSGFWSGESLSHGFNFKTLIQIYLNFLISYAIIAVDKENCLTRFLKLIFVFTVISLIGYFVSNIGGVNLLKSILPAYRYGTSSRTYYGKYVFSILWGSFETDGYKRNIGIYYEPGVHEIILNSAIFVLVFMRKYLNLKDSTVSWMLIIFIVTLITTKSTTGYIGLAVILIGVVLSKKDTMLRTKIVKVVVIGLFLIIADYIGNGTDSIISVNIIHKLQGVQIGGKYNYTSGSARMIPVNIALRSIKENFVLGIGTLRYEHYVESIFGISGGTGNALFGMIASKGLVTTLLLLLMLFEPFWKSHPSKVMFVVFIFMVLNVSFAQAQISYPSFVFISVASYSLANVREIGAKESENRTN